MTQNLVESEETLIDGLAVRFRIVRPVSENPPLTTLMMPLLLMGDSAGGADVWGRALDCFAAQSLPCPVAALDFPGRRFLRHALSTDTLADWTAAFLDELGWPLAHVAAHSTGCQVALALARRHSSRVGGLVLTGPRLPSASRAAAVSLSEINAPCLVLRGERDRVVPLSVARALAEGLPRGKFLPVTNAAHVVPFTHSNSFTRLTLAFLAGAIPRK